MKTYRVIHADCIEAMREAVARGTLVDAVVCDPPYHLTIDKRFANVKHDAETWTSERLRERDTSYARLATGFAGKGWDGGGLAFDPETWRLCHDLLPPGGHLVAFGGSKTYHRMATAIEAAGFEIRDQLSWMYGQGFPKSHETSKHIIRRVGETHPAVQEWSGWGTALKPAHEPVVLARRPLEGTVADNVLAHGTGAINIGGCQVDMPGGRWPANVMHDGSDVVGEALGRGEKFFYCAKPSKAGRVPRGIEEVELSWTSAQGGKEQHVLLTLDQGTSQKKATVVSSSTESKEWSIESCGRMFTELSQTPIRSTIRTRTNSTIESRTWSWLLRSFINVCTASANCEMVCGGRDAESAESGLLSITIILGQTVSLPGANSAASGTQLRISVREKTVKSSHPSIKPVDLMRWLVRMVTRPGGIVLDPFAGTGTTGEAALLEGCRTILIEAEADYIIDIRRRLSRAAGDDEPVRTRTRARGEQAAQQPGELGSESAGVLDD